MEKRVYFKNLNALRFFAATAVIFHHVEQYKYWIGLPNAWGNTTIDALGHKAVSLFFVLSGFLITFLLLTEKEKTGDIHIREFYMRRVLRIWPLYFLIVVLCVFIVPRVFQVSDVGVSIYEGNYALKVVLLFLVLPNLVRVFSPTVVGGNQLWSIGVEEQFYLIWPVLVRWFFNSMIAFLFVFIGIKALIMVGLLAMASVSPVDSLWPAVLRFWQLLQIEQMAIGGVGAWILFHRKTFWMNLIYHRLVWGVCCVAFFVLMVAPFHHWTVSYVEAVVFMILIVNVSTNPRLTFSLEHPVLNTLGNISYGIYMYHTLCITFCLYTLRYFAVHTMNSVLFNVLLYASSVIFTIVIAYFSYEYFEKAFLALKERFMIVKSGVNNAKGHPDAAYPLKRRMENAPKKVRA
jgi:peptidoglycan/LPS O-acetylase OafA/YrhL